MLKQTKQNLIFKVVTSLAIAMNIAYPAIFTNLGFEAIAAENTPLSAEASQLRDRLTGQWQLIPTVNTKDPLKFIFTADGKLYMVNIDQKSAFAFEYQVNTTNGQTYLDVLHGSFASRITVDFSQKGQLILQQLFVPAAFQYSENIFGGLLLPNALFLNRISNDANLPKDIEVTSPPPSGYPIKQSEAKTYVGTLNRAQQAFFLEKNYFTSKIADLDIGISPETENYKYQIEVLNSTKAVQNIGLAKKDGLKSYTGLVYVVQIPNSPDPSTFVITCSSLKPTRQMPPKFVLQPEPECPSGYEKIQ
ncbi:type IV pilin-like G/H family protein [Pseudanabaena sp. 'Roaring Creek']|uniref:type IV pilin-like G/H family protein n=1 Tax=Pseudanabaena sp. 'Roaring Creek' TaxID=1681830 RepID=UPI0006D7C95F|nr:type IV pilin-like G/H family protein [Pseudanabaena sp. 'Roaring Creek']